MADTGHYPIRGLGARRNLPTFDDLVFLTASVSRYPLEGYRERCDTATVLGTRHAATPIELDIPITIAGMSFGALSASAKEALGRAATEVGTSTTTGDGGMTPEERKASALLVYQVLPSRYGFDPADLRQADAVEIVVGQGAKPGGGGMLLGQKVNDRVAAMRTLPPGIDQRSASRHPDWVGPDDLRIKIEELREATDWAHPDLREDGRHPGRPRRQAGRGRRRRRGGGRRHAGRHGRHPGRVHRARRHPHAARRPHGRRGPARHRDDASEVQLVVSGGIRSGADVAKALALGADAVSIGVAALLALGCNRATYRDAARRGRRRRGRLRRAGHRAGHCAHCHTGRCPVGITTQDPALEARLDPDQAADRGGQLPAGDDHGGHRSGPGLRQVRRPPPRARGPGRADRGGGRHGPGPSGRHRLDPRLADLTAVRSRVGGGRGHRWRRGRAQHRPGAGRAGRDRRAGPRRDTVGSGGTGKSSGIVRCHYGIRSLAAMAWHALPVLEHAADVLGAPSGYHQTGYLVGVGPENLGALRANVAMQQALGIEVELVGHDTAQRAVAGGRPRRLRRVRLRAAGRLRRRPPDGPGLRRRRPRGAAPASPAQRRRGHRVGGRRGVHRRPPGRRRAASAPPTSCWRPGRGPCRWPRRSASTCPSGPSGPRSSSSTRAGPLGPVPVFSDLVSLQYVRTEGDGMILLGDSDHSDPEWADPDHYRERAGDDELAACRPEVRPPLPRTRRRRAVVLLRRLLRRHPRLQPDDLGLASRRALALRRVLGPRVQDLPLGRRAHGGPDHRGASRHPDVDHRDFRWERFADERPAGQPAPLRRRRADALTADLRPPGAAPGA